MNVESKNVFTHKKVILKNKYKKERKKKDEQEVCLSLH